MKVDMNFIPIGTYAITRSLGVQEGTTYISFNPDLSFHWTGVGDFKGSLTHFYLGYVTSDFNLTSLYEV